MRNPNGCALPPLFLSGQARGNPPKRMWTVAMAIVGGSKEVGNARGPLQDAQIPKANHYCDDDAFTRTPFRVTPRTQRSPMHSHSAIVLIVRCSQWRSRSRTAFAGLLPGRRRVASSRSPVGSLKNELIFAAKSCSNHDLLLMGEAQISIEDLRWKLCLQGEPTRGIRDSLAEQ